MPVSVREVGPLASSGSSLVDNIDTTVPSSTQDGDVLHALIVHRSPGSSVTAPPGWTLEIQGQQGPFVSDPELYLYSKVASSEPASYNWGLSSSRNMRGVIIAFAGGDPLDPTDDVQVGNGPVDSTPTAPSVTTTRADTMVLVYICGEDGSSSVSFTFPAEFTELFDSAEQLSIAGASMTPGSIGATGTFALTASGATDYVAITIAVNAKPAVDLEVTAESESEALVELAHVDRLETNGESEGEGQYIFGVYRLLEASGESESEASQTITGGTVRIEAAGESESDAEVTFGRSQALEFFSESESDGFAEPGLVQRFEIYGESDSESQIDLTRFRLLEVDGESASEASHTIDLADRVFGYRLRLDILDSSGAVVTRIPRVLGGSYRLGQDQIGEMSLTLPANDERVRQIASGHRVIIYREGEGKVFTGIVDRLDRMESSSGETSFLVTGGSTARELVYRNVLTGRQYAAELVEDITDDLLLGTNWTRGEVETSTTGLSALYTGVSYWEVLTDVAHKKAWHLRENNLTSTIDIGPFGEDSGLVIKNIPQSRGWSDLPLGVLPLTDIKLVTVQDNLLNEITPLGGGEGANALTLQYATRTSPYPVLQGVDQMGNPYWYIEDQASIDAHLRRQQLVSFKDTIPISNSPQGLEDAANALYDQAAAFLQWHSETVQEYEVSCVGLSHYDHGTPIIRPGDTVRVIYSGYVTPDINGVETFRKWETIDATLHVLDFERTFAEDGSDTWKLTVSTSDRRQPTDAEINAEVVKKLFAVETSRRPFTMSDTIGPYKESVDGSHPFEMQANFDANVTALQLAKLLIHIAPVRSNTIGAASGGTSTAQANGVHSHTINTSTADDEADPLHSHQIGVAADIVGWVTPAYKQQMQYAANRNGSATYGIIGGRDGTSLPWTSLFTFSGFSHNHSVNATTSTSGGSHSHSIAPHTHGQEYGIYEGPNPTDPDLRLSINGTDVTTALGGPWNADTEVDVTQYLTDINGQVLRQNHVFEISADELCDVTMTLKSIIVLHSIVPV